MKIVELLKISSELLKMLHENGIGIEDYKYIPMLRDYYEMKERGEKTTYSVMKLSEKYSICERKVYKLLKRLYRNC